MLVPWVNELPPWLSYFLVTARNSAYLIDFLIFHETLSPPTEGLPENVRFIGLGEGGLAQLFGLRMGEELAMPVKNASLLIRSIRFMLDKWPRLVAEYKPAFGTIFDKYLGGYSHWGYCDLDMVIGNVPLFVEEAELEGQASLTPILTTCVYLCILVTPQHTPSFCSLSHRILLPIRRAGRGHLLVRRRGRALLARAVDGAPERARNLDALEGVSTPR